MGGAIPFSPPVTEVPRRMSTRGSVCPWPTYPALGAPDGPEFTTTVPPAVLVSMQFGDGGVLQPNFPSRVDAGSAEGNR